MADEKELEGVVVKRSDSLYYPGKRTRDWIKFKRMVDEDFVVCGYIRKKGNIYSIVLGKPDRNGFVYKGHVTLGVSAANVGSLRRWLGQPFMVYPSDSGNESAVWVYPEKVCTVEYMPNTQNRRFLKGSGRIWCRRMWIDACTSPAFIISHFPIRINL